MLNENGIQNTWKVPCFLVISSFLPLEFSPVTMQESEAYRALMQSKEVLSTLKSAVLWCGVLKTNNTRSFFLWRNGEWHRLPKSSSLLRDSQDTRTAWISSLSARWCSSKMSYGCLKLLGEQTPRASGWGGSSIPWLRRSLDWTLLGFFLWSYVKNIVFSVQKQSQFCIKERIKQAIQSVSTTGLDEEWKNKHSRLFHFSKARKGKIAQEIIWVKFLEYTYEFID